MITETEIQMLDRDFSQSRTVREDAQVFEQLQRGSVRFARGLYRTEDEQDQFIAKGMACKLPSRR